LDFGNLNIFIGAPLNEVGQNVMLEHLKVEGRSVGQTFLSLLRSFFLIFGGILIDSLTDVNEGAVFYLEIVLLQFALDIFDQPLWLRIRNRKASILFLSHQLFHFPIRSDRVKKGDRVFFRIHMLLELERSAMDQLNFSSLLSDLSNSSFAGICHF